MPFETGTVRLRRFTMRAMMSSSSKRLAAIALTLSVSHVIAQTPEPPDSANTAELPTIVVSGEQPGPGLWKVSSGDHVLWILGTLTPLPKDMHWRAKEGEAAIASAQGGPDPPRGEINAEVGFFGKIALFGSLVGVRDNPDHKTLQQVVPPDLYARWIALKTKYFGAGRGRNIETWRPIFAAIELWNEAIRKAGMTRSDVAGDVVDAAAKRAKLEPVAPTLKLDIDDPRGAIREFKSGAMDDLECFSKTLDRIDSDLGTMAVRANAWASG